MTAARRTVRSSSTEPALRPESVKTTGATYTFTRPTALYSTIYNWYVVAWFGGSSAPATQVSFTTAAPNTPYGLDPTGPGTPLDGNFTWSIATTPDSSVIWYGTGVPARIGKTTGATYTFTRPPAQYSTTYNWYVVAWFGPTSAPAAQVSFSTVPSTPTALAPTGPGIGINGNFTWTYDGGAPDSSVIWYGTDFPARIGNTTGAVYTFTRPTALNSTTYNWYVVAWYMGSSTPAAQVSFTTVGSGQASWTSMTPLPPGGKAKNIKDGGALAYAPPIPSYSADTSYIYAFKGNNTYEFYRYNTISNVWISRDSIPAKDRLSKKKGVKKGAALIVGADGKVYGTKGNNTYNFWCYDPAQPVGQHWAQLNDVPTGTKKVKEGTGLAAVTFGHELHLLPERRRHLRILPV